MSKPLKPRRGTTAQHASFIGEAHEVTYDTDKQTLVAHDGLTAGGFPLAKEEEVAALDSTLRTLIAEEVAKYLPLAGGAMTGNVWFEQSGDAVLYRGDASNRFIIRGGTSGFPDGASWYLHGKNHPEYPGYLVGYAHDGTKTSNIELRPDGTFLLGGKNILTSAGGDVNGELNFNPTAQNGINAVLVNRNDGYVQFCGSSAWANGAVCTLHGKTYTIKPGWVELRATDGTNSASLVLKPNGELLRSGNSVPSVATWRSGNNWYRKWSDGWIEQGGLIGARTGRDIAVTFNTAFTNTNYTLTYGSSTGSAGNGSQSDRIVWSSRTTTGFTFQRIDSNATYASWYACGY